MEKKGKAKVLSATSSPACGCYDCQNCISFGTLEVLTDDNQVVSVPYSHLGSMGEKKKGDIILMEEY
jgi:hypothetical protein